MSRPDVVEVLVDTDLRTMIKAIWSQNPSEIRMVDGSVPTEEQRRLILSATALDLEAAKQAVKSRAAVERRAALRQSESSGEVDNNDDGLW